MRRFQTNRRLAIAVLMLAVPLATCGITIAQPPSLPAAVPPFGADPPQRRSIISPEVAELEIAFGRLRLMPSRFRVIRRHETFAGPAGLRTVQVSTVDGRPTLRASYRDETENWTMQLDATVGAQWSREAQVGGRSVKIDYSQRPQQPIVISITGLHPQPTVLRGATLWHLTEQNSDEFVQCVLPALQRLNSAWDLRGTLAQAKHFRQVAGWDERIDQATFDQWINDLESDDRATRTTAVQQLRLAGVTAQLPLLQLTHGTLTTQQRKTIEQLLAALEPRTADTPTRLAYWLSGDPSWR